MKCKKGDWLIGMIFILFALVLLFPLVITFSNGLMSVQEVKRHYVYQKNRMVVIPDEVTLRSYGDILFNQPKYLLYFLNSVKITVPIVIGQLGVAFGAAYAFWQSKFRAKKLLFNLYILVMLLPMQVVMVPNYMVIQKLHLMDHHLAIILPGIFSPFGVFLLTQFMKSIPEEYVEAAQIDGAGQGAILREVILPMMKSGLFSLAILTLIEYWNVVEPALVFLQDIYKSPLSVFLSEIGQDQMGLIFAASCLYMLPILITFLVGQDYLIEGIERSGVKG